MFRSGSHRRGSFALAVLIALLLGASACSGGDDAPGQGAADTSSQAKVPTQSIFLAGEVVVLTDSGDDVPIRGATVVMRPQRGGKELRFVTSRGGSFSKRGMPPGTYEVSVEGLQRGQTFTPIEFSVSGTSYDVFGPRLVVTD
jgi:hypothetical protein